MKLMVAVFLLIVAALVASAYFDFSPAIPIFAILGFGIYMVGRMDSPQLPEGTHVGWGNTYGVHLSGQDFVPPDTSSHSGGNLRDGVDPNEPRR
jgi:hypothetical protein